jgi:hypothetical protein
MKLFIKEKCGFSIYTTAPSQVFEEFRNLAEADQETLWILGLNTKNRVRCKEIISAFFQNSPLTGTASGTMPLNQKGKT